MEHILRLRLDKAKELLRNTDLAITDIAMDVGFGSHTHFTRTFSKRAGLTPSAFRILSRKQMGAELDTNKNGKQNSRIISNIPAEMELGRLWQPLCGTWIHKEGIVWGTAEEDTVLRYARRLPENFAIQLELRFTPTKELGQTEFHLRLEDNENQQTYCLFKLGINDNTSGTLARTGLAMQGNFGAVFKPNHWQKVRVELKDDHLQLRLDDEMLFRFRDPFPAPYLGRCKLSFGSWRSNIQIRNISIEDLGFLPLIRTVRQGDSLFNLQLYDQARDFYMRLLESDVSFADQMELHYKIAMCYVRQGLYAEARPRLLKVATLPLRDFWGQHARLALLEVGWKEGRHENLVLEMKQLFGHKPLCDGIRQMAKEAADQYNLNGFYTRALKLQQMLSEVENKSVLCRQNHLDLAEALITLNHFEQAEKELLRLAESTAGLNQIHTYTLLTLADVQLYQGKTSECMQTLELARSRTQNQTMLAHCDIHFAGVLRSQERMPESIALLEDVPRKYPNVGRLAQYAELMASLTWCALENCDEALRILERIKQKSPDHPNLAAGSGSKFLFVPHLVKGDFLQAAEIIHRDAQHNDDRAALHALQAIRAGIVFELAGNVKAARKIWSNVTRRYPSSAVPFLGMLAHNLLGGSVDQLESMPYPMFNRSEIFYLVALLEEKRGEKSAADLLEMSWKEDRSLIWPAYLAKQRLQKLRP